MNFDYDDGLPFPKYPVVGWSSDAYINWLTKEGVSQELSFFGDLTGKLLGTGIQMIAGSGIIGGNFGYQPQHMYSPRHSYNTSPDLGQVENIGKETSSSLSNMTSAGSLLSNMINIIDSDRRANMLPAIQGSKSNANIMWSMQMVGFSFKQIRAKDCYLKSIDNFFTMFGYKVNVTESPLKYRRKTFDYKKTLNCDFTGNIPDEDLNILNNAFNSGIRIWHYGPNVTMYDFDSDNSITNPI